MVARMRTLPKAVEEIKKQDPESCINIHALRHWVKQKKIPSVKAGKNYFINMADLENYLTGN